MRTYEVIVRYHGETTYVVKASSPQEAERIGRRRYDHGEEGGLPHDWEQIQGSTVKEAEEKK